MNPNINPACKVHVLAVSPFESDHVLLAHIFGHTAWQLDNARSVREAMVKLYEPRLNVVPPVILCEETLSDGGWQDLFRITRELSDPHSLIVTSAKADDRLWAEVLNMGAYDVLQKPFRPQEVFRTIGLAWADRRMAVSRTLSRTAQRAAGAAVAVA